MAHKVAANMLVLRNGSSFDEFVKASEAMVKFSGNVLSHPDEPKYRRIKVSHPPFVRVIGSRPGGIAALTSLGFVEVIRDGEKFLEMENIPDELPAVHALLVEALKQAQSNAAQQTTPTPTPHQTAPTTTQQTTPRQTTTTTTTTPQQTQTPLPAWQTPAPGAGFGGLGGFGGLSPQNLRGMNPQQLMSDPAVQQAMRDPAFMQRAQQMMQDPESMRQAMEMARAMGMQLPQAGVPGSAPQIPMEAYDEDAALQEAIRLSLEEANQHTTTNNNNNNNNDTPSGEKDKDV